MANSLFVEFITSYIIDEKDIVLVVGDESNNPLDEIIKRPIIKTNSTDIKYVLSLIAENTMVDILRVNDPDSLETYIDFVSEGGLIILDNLERFKEKLEHIVLDNKPCSQISHLGEFSTMFSSNKVIVLRRKPVESNIIFAIVIATYHRSNGKTKSYLERCFRYIAGQSYQKYKVFLIGDRYEKKEEFESFAQLLPREQLETVNLPIALERDNCKIRYNLWTIGGTNAMNTGINLAVEQGFIHYVHLDDDDYWHSFHLRNMAMAYEQFPEAYMTATRGIFIDETILPNINGGLRYNNFECKGGNVFHSSFGFRLDKFPYRYIQLDLSKPEIMFPAADAHMLDRIRQSCIENGYNVLAIPMITCFHDCEKGILS